MAQPKTKRQKQIKLKDIQKTYQQMNTYKTHLLNEDDNTVIKYLETFSEDRIQELMKEAHRDSVYVEENGLDTFKDEDEQVGTGDLKFIKYVCFLIIKHMTQLIDEIPDSFEEKAAIFNQIESIGLYHEMIEEVFNPEEVGKVIERVITFASLAHQVAELEAETRQKALQTVQHPLMKKKLEEGMTNA